MITKVENGLIESYKSGSECLVPDLLFNPQTVTIEDDGIHIKGESFVSKAFPFKEFVVIINLSYEFINDSDFLLIYLAKDNKKSGIKIEKDNLSNYSTFKIAKTTSCVSIYYKDGLGEWIFVSSFNPPFDYDELGFYGTVDFTIHELTIYKNPFIRVFTEKQNIQLLINNKPLIKNDGYFLYEYQVEKENENASLVLKVSGITTEEKSIVVDYGDVYFIIEKELYIDNFSLSNFNILTESYKKLTLVNPTMNTYHNVKIYATYEPALKIYFSSINKGEMLNSLIVEKIMPGESIDFIVYVEKISATPYHRYNFNIIIE